MTWWQRFFGQEYVAAWTAAGVFDRTADEVDAITSLLDLPPGARILDVPCGFGRIAGPLHERGFDVVGVDASPAQVELAHERHPGPTYLIGDMREPPAGPFEAVLNIFSSFGYFDEVADDVRALGAWYEVLNPGGVLLMDLNHRDHLARHFQPVRGTTVVEQTKVDWIEGVVESSVQFEDWSDTFRVRLYTATEVVRMLRDVGFTRMEAFGDFDRRTVSPDTRLVLLAVR